MEIFGQTIHNLNSTGRYLDKPYTTSTQQGDIWTQTQLTMKIFGLKLNSTGRYLDTTSTKHGDIWTKP